jgi:hypothetical protein
MYNHSMSAEELNDLKPVVVELKEADPVKEVEKKSSFWKRICFCCCCPRRSNRRNSKALEMKRLEETKPEEGTTKPDEGTTKPDEGTTKPDEGTNEKATNEEATNEEATNEEAINEEGTNEEGTNEEGTNEEATADEVNAGIAHSSKSVVVFEADNPKTWPGFAEALEIIQKRQSTATNAKKKNASFYKNKKKNKNQKNQTNASSEALSETPLSETPLSETPLSEALSEPPLSPEYVVVSPQNRPMKQTK